MSLDTFFADAHAGMAAAGADFFGAYTAIYTAPGGGAATSVRVLLERGVQQVGEFGGIGGYRDEAEIDLTQVASPANLGTLVIDGTTYKLDTQISNDGITARWSLRRG